MSLFIFFAALMVAMTVFLLSLPLWRPRLTSESGTSRSAANLAIYRGQLEELEREHAEGSLGDADYAAARTELQRRLLAEAGTQDAGSAGNAKTKTAEQVIPPSLQSAVAVLILVPLAALGGYLWLGTPEALQAKNAPAQEQNVTQAQIEGMVARLAERLKTNPNDTQGWMMLARSYKALGRLPEAADAYAKIENEIAKEPDLLVDYAEILGTMNRSFQGKPSKLIAQALKIEPKHVRGLLMAGVVAMEKKDYKTTIAKWEEVLSYVDPNSETAAMVKDGLVRIRQSQAAQGAK